ncbi:uncharacterized protein LTR77_008384 [Saxophila tyrrhenica]|uniref:Imidazoleglycerol-phosphate dehydratase n=1 Tax=Saxophila tyrrhenica TaxID=1690608 RepID=A0AAV9P4W5_9PEZI|nr:hypothetical protein LTR77_008384 [Saxophila tyrrhenica]
MSDRTRGSLTKDAELNDAAWVAARGATVGAAKWGLFSAAAAAVAYNFSPIYRGLTFQFKVYVSLLPNHLFGPLLNAHCYTRFLQMSGMCIGSMIEADKRLRAHELLMRQRKRIARDAEVWRRYEEELHGVAPEKLDNRE